MSKQPYATLIRGGTLILPDGDVGVRAESGDLLIEADRITRVGAVDDPPEGTRVIYASGCAVDLTPQNGSRGNLTIWVEKGRSECRRRGTALSRSYASSGRLKWSWRKAGRSRMPAAS